MSTQKNHKKYTFKGMEEKRGITLIALVITIVLNSSYLAMDRMNKIEKEQSELCSLCSA